MKMCDSKRADFYKEMCVRGPVDCERSLFSLKIRVAGKNAKQASVRA